MRSSRSTAIAFATTMMIAAPAGANLLVNGSFELGPNPGSFTNLASGSSAITGWTVALGNIDYIGFLWAASNGSRSLDLEGSAGTCDLFTPNCPGGIAQTFATVPGQQYRVTFDIAGNLLNVPVTKNIIVSAAGQTQSFSFNTTGHSTGSMGWATHTWDFTAIGATTKLEFDSADHPATGWGVALDNVSVDPIAVAAVPEPETYALMVGGLAVLGGLARRRRSWDNQD